MKLFLIPLLVLFSSVFLSSCGEEKGVRVKYSDAIAYAPIYSQEISEWLQSELNKEQLNLAKIKSELRKKPNDKTLLDSISDSERILNRLKFRIDHGDYFQFKGIEKLPTELAWTSGERQPEIGDSKAKKGGVFTDYIPSFPSTLRPFGKESNNSFRGKLYDEIGLGMVGVHPTTMKSYPSLAKEWAIDTEARTVYYKLDLTATFSDGVPVKAIDYITAIYIRVSPFVKDPYAKQYYREQFAGVTVYGEDVVAVTLPEQKPRMEQSASLAPAPAHFYADYGPDFEDYYQWKVPPTTGAYFVKPEDIRKGRSVTLTRHKEWWAKDKRYFKYRFNPDKITYQVVGDKTKAFELFRVGKIDYFNLSDPDYWFEKSEIPPVFNGYIERYKFYNQYPRVPRGFYLNVSRPKLKDINMRIGIQHSLNWQKVIDVYFRGEFSRLQRFHEGYGEFSNENINAREFSVSKAREYYAKAGYTKLNSEGYLENTEGEKLSVGVTYYKSPKLGKIMSLLQEEAKKIGFHLRLDELESTVSYQKVMRKEHEMTFWGWNSGPPFPSFYQFFHSSNAFDEKGNPKQNTNNINCYASDQMDAYCVATRNARTEEELLQACLDAQQLIYDEAIFVPSYANNFYSVGCWRWLRWPDTSETPFNAPVSDEALSSYVFWIDQEIKEETMEALRSDETFPEVQKVIDVFRDGIPESFSIPNE